MHNALTDPIIRIHTDAGDERVTMPGLYAALMTDRVASVTALRPHQRHAWHAFVVQVGALALLAADISTLPESEDDWRGVLRRLTSGDEPWTLIVDDLAKPALLQPPVPEGSLDVLKETEATPDAIDLVPTSKNHDLKAAIVSPDDPDAWLFALLTLQTGEGYAGSGNYGISRMNKGKGSRPGVGLAPKGGWGARVKRDITRLLVSREQILDDYPHYEPTGGLGLVWLEPWDGATQIEARQLDPYYVEICRRIRLVADGDTIVARRATSTVARILAPEGTKGVTGDPWAPINRKDGAALLHLDGRGWNYSRVAAILDSEKFTAAPLQIWETGDGPQCSLIMMGMARGDTTDGYHERAIPIPSRAVPLFGAKPDRLGRVCRERVDDASTMRKDVLFPALRVLAKGDGRKVNSFTAAFDGEIDRVFFDSLFRELAETGDAALEQRKQWIADLLAIAEAALAQAEQSVPIPQARRHSIIAAARSRLHGAYQFHFGKNGEAE
jgi:CRISPR system Cascade subunit CasA